MLWNTNNGIPFDFDTGHIIESPCRKCPKRDRLPDCAENCPTLDRVQMLLSGAITCSKCVPETEGYTISLPTT
jgi:hypothetical protein